MPVGQVNTALGSLNLVFWHPRPDSVAEEGCGPCTRGGPSVSLYLAVSQNVLQNESI